MATYNGLDVHKPTKPAQRGDLYVFLKTSADQVIINETSDKRLSDVVGQIPYFVSGATVE